MGIRRGTARADTGALVQKKEKCRRGHFWVMVAARDHVFFHYSWTETL